MKRRYTKEKLMVAGDMDVSDDELDAAEASADGWPANEAAADGWPTEAVEQL